MVEKICGKLRRGFELLWDSCCVDIYRDHCVVEWNCLTAVWRRPSTTTSLRSPTSASVRWLAFTDLPRSCNDECSVLMLCVTIDCCVCSDACSLKEHLAYCCYIYICVCVLVGDSEEHVDQYEGGTQVVLRLWDRWSQDTGQWPIHRGTFVRHADTRWLADDQTQRGRWRLATVMYLWLGSTF